MSDIEIKKERNPRIDTPQGLVALYKQYLNSTAEEQRSSIQPSLQISKEDIFTKYNDSYEIDTVKISVLFKEYNAKAMSTVYNSSQLSIKEEFQNFASLPTKIFGFKKEHVLIFAYFEAISSFYNYEISAHSPTYDRNQKSKLIEILLENSKNLPSNFAFALLYEGNCVNFDTSESDDFYIADRFDLKEQFLFWSYMSSRRFIQYFLSVNKDTLHYFDSKSISRETEKQKEKRIEEEKQQNLKKFQENCFKFLIEKLDFLIYLRNNHIAPYTIENEGRSLVRQIFLTIPETFPHLIQKLTLEESFNLIKKLDNFSDSLSSETVWFEWHKIIGSALES